MISAEYVQPVLGALGVLCYVVLGIYILRVASFILLGNGPGDTRNLREAMAMVYTVTAAVLIGLSVRAIRPFVANVIEAVGLIGSVSAESWGASLSLCAGLVCAAFICNFSRSLWMLKSLDHAVFEPVPDWGTLSAPLRKRIPEFAVRTVAAVLFIFLEFELKALALSTPGTEAVAISGSASPRNYLTDAGKLGILLYIVLIAWWMVGRFLVTRTNDVKMPKRIFFFYLAGLVNSGFIFLYGGADSTPERAIGLVASVVIVTLAAVYMLCSVLLDVVSTLRVLLRELRTVWLQLYNGRNLSHI